MQHISSVVCASVRWVWITFGLLCGSRKGQFGTGQGVVGFGLVLVRVWEVLCLVTGMFKSDKDWFPLNSSSFSLLTLLLSSSLLACVYIPLFLNRRV